MKLEDYEKVYELWINTPGMGLNTTDDSREGIAQYLKRNPNTCFVAVEEGKIFGSILAGNDGRRGYISHTVVSSECRRKGIGRKLVELTMKALETEGIHKVNLVVFARNKLGNDFWEKLGFTVRDDLVYRNKLIHEMVRIDT